MVCIYCGNTTHVINSRLQKRQNHIWRRRQCDVCSSVYTTLERPDHAQSFMVQSHDHYAPFYRDKFYISVYESCRHRDTAVNDATALTDTIINKLLLTAQQGLLQRESIIRTTQQVLNNFDTAAAVYYTAYYDHK